MNSLATTAAATTAPMVSADPDYCARALALWPRLDRGRLARVRHDPSRVAALVSRRTTLSSGAILQLLGAPPAPTDAPARDH
jgi:hypothetical protein